jgi:hypothetical protein
VSRAARLPEKPVRIFVVGRNEWREEKAWPLELPVVRAQKGHMTRHARRPVRYKIFDTERGGVPASLSAASECCVKVSSKFRPG